RAGYLDTLFTDMWLATRRHEEVPDDKVVAFTMWALLDRLFYARTKTTQDVYREYIRIGRRFALNVQASLFKRQLPSAYLAYTTGALETLEFLRAEGVPAVVDQIDPGRIEDAIVRREAERWPGWMALPGTIPDAYFDRIEREWELATRVVVNSDWSRKAL